MPNDSTPAPIAAVDTSRPSYGDIVSMAADLDAPAAEEAPEQVESAPAEGAVEDTGDAEPEKKAQEKKEPEPKKSDKPNAFKLKSADGKAIEVPADATFTFKVDGKEVEVTAADAFRDRQIETRFHKKMAEAAEKQKEVEAKGAELVAKEAEIQRHTQVLAAHLGAMHHAIREGDVRAFVTEFATMNGISPKEVNARLRGHYLEQSRKYYDADENGRKILDYEDDSGYAEIEAQRQREAQARVQRRQVADKYAEGAAKQAGISREEFILARAKVVKERLNGQSPDLESLADDQIRGLVEAVIATALIDKQSSSVGSLIAEVAPDLKDEDPEEYRRISKIVSPFMDEYDHESLKAVVRNALKLEPKAEPEDEEEDATPIQSSQAKPRPRTSPATSDTDADEEFAEVRRQAEEDGLAVYGR